MPLTAITVFISMIATFCSWLFVSMRLRTSPAANTYQARLLATSFLFSTTYGAFMFIPYLLIVTGHEDKFPLVMAVSFVFAHILLYLSFLQMLRLTFSIVPRLNNKQYLAIGYGVVAILVMAALATATMIFGTHPEYNAAARIVNYNLSPLVNGIDAVVGLTMVVPTGVLMIINGIINPAMRTRSLLLGCGMITLMITGPMIEGAKGMAMFALANSLSVVGLLVLTLGVAYRMDQKLSLAASPSRA